MVARLLEVRRRFSVVFLTLKSRNFVKICFYFFCHKLNLISGENPPLKETLSLQNHLFYSIKRVCVNVAGRDSRVEAAGAGAGNAPPGIPRAFDTFAVPGRREFDDQSLPGGGEFELHPRFHVKSLAW